MTFIVPVPGQTWLEKGAPSLRIYKWWYFILCFCFHLFITGHLFVVNSAWQLVMGCRKCYKDFLHFNKKIKPALLSCVWGVCRVDDFFFIKKRICNFVNMWCKSNITQYSYAHINVFLFILQCSLLPSDYILVHFTHIYSTLPHSFIAANK